MKISEGVEELERIRNEFGDADMLMPDQLEPTWHNPITSIEFDSDHQSVILSAD